MRSGSPAPSSSFGTTDVDVVLPLALAYDRDDEGQDFGWLEAALARAEFAPETQGTGDGGWRWRTRERPPVPERMTDDG